MDDHGKRRDFFETVPDGSRLVVIALAKKTRIRRNFSVKFSINSAVLNFFCLQNLTSGVCPFHSVQGKDPSTHDQRLISPTPDSVACLELLRDDQELFHSTSPLLPCRCLNRSRSTPALTDLKPSMAHFRRLSSPCSSTPSGTTVVTTDSGLNTSTGCTTSRSPTPDLGDHGSSMTFEIDSLFDRTLTKTINSSKSNGKKRLQKSDRSLSTSIHGRSDRVKRVLKR